MAGRPGVRLLLLAAAAVCVLVALRLLPAFTAPADLGPQSASIDNDTGAPVVIWHCVATCAASGTAAKVAPGHQLRVGPPGSAPVWLVERSDGARLGCLRVAVPGERLPVSRAGPCPG